MRKVSYTVEDLNDGKKYTLSSEIKYHSTRYNKWKTVSSNFRSDGATGAYDIDSIGWWLHDSLCEYGVWDDGTACTNWQASAVLSDILREEGRIFRSVYWRWSTYLFREFFA